MAPLGAVFVDTGAWVALIKRDDRAHIEARRYYERLFIGRIALLTSNYVVDETVTRLRYDVGLHAARDFRVRLAALNNIRRARIVWVDEDIEAEGWRVLEQYADIPLSLTDATSAVIARSARITSVFGFDRHFRALGFTTEPMMQ